MRSVASKLVIVTHHRRDCNVIVHSFFSFVPLFFFLHYSLFLSFNHSLTFFPSLSFFSFVFLFHRSLVEMSTLPPGRYYRSSLPPSAHHLGINSSTGSTHTPIPPQNIFFLSLSFFSLSPLSGQDLCLRLYRQPELQRKQLPSHCESCVLGSELVLSACDGPGFWRSLP